MIDTNVSIQEIMTTSVISVAPDANILKIKEIFESHDIHHIPVLKNKKVVGIISKSDYYQLQHHFTCFKLKSSEVSNKAVMGSILAEEIMTPKVAMLHPENKITLAVSLFRENLFHAIPIVDKEYCLVGILTTYDLINYAFREPFLID